MSFELKQRLGWGVYLEVKLQAATSISPFFVTKNKIKQASSLQSTFKLALGVSVVWVNEQVPAGFRLKLVFGIAQFSQFTPCHKKGPALFFLPICHTDLFNLGK